MQNLLNEWFRENAMLDEATRVMRRFFRTGGDTGKGLNYVVLTLVSLFYLWFLVMIVRVGENLSVGILVFEMFVITLVTPLSVYGAVSGEREKATWDALVLTRLTPAQIMAGKISWRIVVALLIMAVFAIPLILSQMVGHNSRDPSGLAVLFGEFLVLAWAVLLCCFGLWISSNTKNSVTSVAVLVASLLGYLVFLPILLSIFSIHMPDAMNPFTAVSMLQPSYSFSGEEQGTMKSSVVILPFLYLGLCVLFLAATRIRLSRMEEPSRKAQG